MNKQWGWLVLAASVALAGCGEDKNGPVYQRKQIFKQMLKTREALQGMLNERTSYNAAYFLELSRELDASTRRPWPLFTELHEGDKTHAKAEVWADAQSFKAAQDTMMSATQALVTAATGKPSDKGQLRAPFSRVEQSCKQCHDRFRVD